MLKEKGLRILLLCTVCTILAAKVTAAEVAVIAHRSVPVAEISPSELLDVYTGDIKEWSNGEQIIVTDLKPKNDVKTAFYDFIGKTSSRMKSIWMKNMLSGEGQPPQAFDSEEELLEKVATTPGAIGYIDASLLNNDVITLAIIPVKHETAASE